ncbi:MAG: hypothetical protein VKK59_03095 [Vampirovibrionales bacterium]|nr:hypothetical protein [Vampirovibrionales bacterium]
MSSNMIDLALDLKDNPEVHNQYELVLQVAELAKGLLEEERQRRGFDPFAEAVTGPTTEKVIHQALIMKASELDLSNELIG